MKFELFRNLCVLIVRYVSNATLVFKWSLFWCGYQRTLQSTDTTWYQTWHQTLLDSIHQTTVQRMYTIQLTCNQCFCSAKILVSTPRKVLTFIIKKTFSFIKVSKKTCASIVEKALLRVTPVSCAQISWNFRLNSITCRLCWPLEHQGILEAILAKKMLFQLSGDYHSCWRASFLAFCLCGRPAIYTIYITYISCIYSMYIGKNLSQAPVIDMKCNLFTGMGAVARSPFASAI